MSSTEIVEQNEIQIPKERTDVEIEGSVTVQTKNKSNLTVKEDENTKLDFLEQEVLSLKLELKEALKKIKEQDEKLLFLENQKSTKQEGLLPKEAENEKGLKNHSEISSKKIEDGSDENEDFFLMKDKAELVEDCKQMSTKLKEMERFFADHGLEWIGDQGKEEENDEDRLFRLTHTTRTFVPNFEKVFSSIDDLNIMATEPQIIHTRSGATFKQCELLNLTLYSDGMKLENEEFREYSSISVQDFFQDIEDGYYPTELKGTYPNGVVLKVDDQRSKTYAESQGFLGKGQKLGSKEPTSNQPKPNKIFMYERKYEISSRKVKPKESEENESISDTNKKNLATENKKKYLKTSNTEQNSVKASTDMLRNEDIKEQYNENKIDFKVTTDGEKTKTTSLSTNMKIEGTVNITRPSKKQTLTEVEIMEMPSENDSIRNVVPRQKSLNSNVKVRQVDDENIENNTLKEDDNKNKESSSPNDSYKKPSNLNIDVKVSSTSTDNKTIASSGSNKKPSTSNDNYKKPSKLNNDVKVSSTSTDNKSIASSGSNKKLSTSNGNIRKPSTTSSSSKKSSSTNLRTPSMSMVMKNSTTSSPAKSITSSTTNSTTSSKTASRTTASRKTTSRKTTSRKSSKSSRNIRKPGISTTGRSITTNDIPPVSVISTQTSDHFLVNLPTTRIEGQHPIPFNITNINYREAPLNINITPDALNNLLKDETECPCGRAERTTPQPKDVCDHGRIIFNGKEYVCDHHCTCGCQLDFRPETMAREREIRSEKMYDTEYSDSYRGPPLKVEKQYEKMEPPVKIKKPNLDTTVKYDNFTFMGVPLETDEEKGKSSGDKSEPSSKLNERTTDSEVSLQIKIKDDTYLAHLHPDDPMSKLISLLESKGVQVGNVDKETILNELGKDRKIKGKQSIRSNQSYMSAKIKGKQSIKSNKSNMSAKSVEKPSITSDGSDISAENKGKQSIKSNKLDMSAKSIGKPSIISDDSDISAENKKQKLSLKNDTTVNKKIDKQEEKSDEEIDDDKGDDDDDDDNDDDDGDDDS